MSKCIFLDRDGVINKDLGYVYKWDDFKFLPGVIEALKDLTYHEISIVIVTNQSGIARGFYTEQEFLTLNDCMLEYFKSEGIQILDVFYCPHLTSGIVPKYAVDCSCRKPKSGMFHLAFDKYNIDPFSSIMVGDKVSDIVAATNAGIHTSYFVGNRFEENTGGESSFNFGSLIECVEHIIHPNSSGF
jgi:D-glycero-D-manno-heptose 1,7-bisphosphate phosphatase